MFENDRVLYKIKNNFEVEIMKTWNSFPETFSYLKKRVIIFQNVFNKRET